MAGLILAGWTTTLSANEIEFQTSILAPNNPTSSPFSYFAGFAPVIDENDVYYFADYGENLYRHRNGLVSLIVSNRDARAPEIRGFVDMAADNGLVIFGASTVNNFGPGLSPATVYYSWSNGVIHRLIAIGDVIPGTTNVVTGLSASKIYQGAAYLYCSVTGGVGSVVRFDNGIATSICFTGSTPVDGGPALKNLSDYSIVQDAIYLVSQNQIQPPTSSPIVNQYLCTNGQLRYLRSIALPIYPNEYGPAIMGMTVDGPDIAMLMWVGAGIRSSVYRFSGGVLKEEFTWMFSENGSINGIPVTTIDAIALHRGNLIMKFGSSPLYGYLPRGVSGAPSYFNLDPKVFSGDFTRGIRIDNNSFVLESGAGLVRINLILPDASIKAVDFDGDGIPDPSLFEDNVATWFNYYSSNGFNTVAFGYTGIQAVPVDYDGDGKADIAVYDPNTGVWNRYFSDEKKLHTDQFGYPGVKPVMEDYDGDGLADLAVYDESVGLWYIFSTSKGFSVTQFGYPGTEAVPHDFDGDQITDLAVYDRSNGMWYRFGSSAGFRMDQFGFPDAAPKPADFDGDGKADLGVFNTSNGNWYLFGSKTGFKAANFGYSGVEAIPSDIDGDGKADLAVYDPKTGKWYYFGSQKGYGDRQL